MSIFDEAYKTAIQSCENLSTNQILQLLNGAEEGCCEYDKGWIAGLKKVLTTRQ